VYLRTFIHSPRGSGGGYYYGLIGTTSANSMTIGGLTVGSAHTYLVKASAAGVVSPYSAALSIVTTSPQPPQNLRLTALTTTTTSLAWDPSPGPVPIVSYSLIDYGSGSAVTNAAGLTNTFITLTGLVPGSYHYYEVVAFDAAGHSSAGATYLIVWNPLPTPATLASAAVANVTGAGAAGFQFSVQAGLVRTTLIQATTNPADPASWVTIATNPPSSSFTYTDTNSSQFPLRFYRVVSP
ncbi:MAG TPA: fibronectin type III domain-containing protein, partial [Verrucomicrobiae bacterium]|nr:fibronectin type III domain-containing protein [Verrucomicrobiae bacterium]